MSASHSRNSRSSHGTSRPGKSRRNRALCVSVRASYLAADAIGVSGVLATTTSGLLMGWYQHETFSPQPRLQAHAAWSVAVFVLEALLFILIGLSLRGILARFDGHAATTLLPLALLISFGVIAARLVWVFPATYLPRVRRSCVAVCNI